jgi:protease IV
VSAFASWTLRPGARRTGLALLCAALFANRAFAVAPTPEPPELLTGAEGVATTDDASSVLYNPASLGVRYPSEAFLSWSRYTGNDQINHGVFALNRFGVYFTRIKDQSQYYAGNLALGGERLRFGIAYGVIKSGLGQGTVGDTQIGELWRPAPAWSFGAAIPHLFQPKLDGIIRRREYALGLGWRPFSSFAPGRADLADRVTLNADLVVPDDGEWSQSRSRFGVELEPWRGLLLRGSIEDHGGVHAGVGLRWPNATLSAHRANAGTGFKDYDTYSVSVHGGEELSGLVGPRDRRVAAIRVAGEVADESMGGVSLLGGTGGTVTSAPIRRQLDRALSDPLTSGVLLEIEGISGMAQLEELRPRIGALRAAGKPVVAWLPMGGGRPELYLASACDRVVSTPEADFQQLGLRSERRYYRRFLASLGVRLDRTSIGEYKSAFRNYSVDSTSAADREVIERTLDVAQRLFVDPVAASRHMERERLLTLLDGRRWSATEVASAGLIDSVGYREDAVRLIGQLAKLGPRPRIVPLESVPAAKREWPAPRPVAVIYASGGIDVGASGNDLLTGPFMGSTTLVRQIDEAFRGSSVRAVVLRVESPGGSTLASDLIRHELERMKRETHKPLIVSMGSSAASGGYEISLPGDVLFTDRITRTGSIGVLFVKPSLQGFYDRHQVHQDAFDRGRWMGMGSIGRDWTPAEQAIADSAIAREYHEFVGQVAGSRRMPYDSVETVARGRVWLGEDALERRLVDRIGGLDDAVAEARRRAGVPVGQNIELIEYRRPKPSWIERVVGAQIRDTMDREARLPDPEATYEWDDGDGGP